LIIVFKSLSGAIIIISLRLICYRLAMSVVALSLLGVSARAPALGLSEIKLKSNLGQSFLAHVYLVGDDVDLLTANCVRARVMSFDGVLLANLSVAIKNSGSQKYLSLTSTPAINEPAIKLQVHLNCETQLQRMFSILLDPPLTKEVNETKELIPTQDSELKKIAPIVSREEKSTVSTGQKNVQASRKKAGLETSIDLTKSPVLNNLVKKSKQSRDVLKLSSDMVDYAPIAGLRMSEILSSSQSTALAHNMDELRAAQARMAAILRDEPAYNSNKVDQNNSLAQIEQLKKESAVLKQKSIDDQSALSQIKQDYENIIRIGSVFLILILISGLGIAAYIFIRKQKSKDGRWWENAVEKSESVQEPVCITEIVNNVQASFDETSPALVKNSNQVLRTPEVAQFDKTVVLEREHSEINSSIKETRTPTLEETNSSIFNFFLPRASTVKVEEISDVTQEAEFWISMNDPQRAIEILQHQEEIESPESPLPWLFLLDLYRVIGNKERYDLLRERFKLIFNAKVPVFEDEINIEEERHIEDFTHLMNRISNFWFTSEVIPYLESLLVDDRDGNREGFDLPVYRDILMLLSVAHELERIASIEGQVPARKVAKKINPEIFPDTGDDDLGVIEFESIDFQGQLKKQSN
jgi:hypothetical protein